MKQHILSAALTFTVLFGGTAAIVSDLVAAPRSSAPAVASVAMPMVVVTGKRAAPVQLAEQSVANEPTQVR